MYVSFLGIVKGDYSPERVQNANGQGWKCFFSQPSSEGSLRGYCRPARRGKVDIKWGTDTFQGPYDPERQYDGWETTFRVSRAEFERIQEQIAN